MGISGLLPALKPIQKTKHLSDFQGKTIAVDAYVWLHKGVYACATELATGKPTHKYVDYAMHRVRLLRHFGIEPYIVFDGGPLPAKRGTESERKQRREENLSRGKAFAAQGKHSQARDCFVKCVDVTPQMAYQLIKALRVENVQYVVAPYEADAQLAYLERIGLVSAILTEDSDLLVFDCKNVLFKLDHIASTVCHISRSDFGSVRSTASDSTSISLHGWNDTQFRAMAILSGCDYLPSIPGIGLKTANNLLRKWKNAEAVVRAVMLEGKKNVPNGYMKQFNLAEKCFRFQRVYDPLKCKLVHLTEIEGEWDDEVDAYVGEDMDSELAMGIALGEVDPVTGEPIKDINPNFKPHGIKSLQKVSKSPRKDKGKGKATSGILSFFGSNPVIPREKPPAPKSNPKFTSTGLSSGKRRLGDVLDQDLAQRKQSAIQSKFFHAPSSRQSSLPRRFSEGPVAGPSRIPEHNKENICITIDDDDDDDDAEILSSLSLKANVSPTQDLDFDFDKPEDGVEQEDGYMSPLSTYSPEIQELSSPTIHVFTPLKKKKRKSSGRNAEEDQVDDVSVRERRDGEHQDDDFDVEPISSPVATIKKRRRQSCSPRVGSTALCNGLHPQTPTRPSSTGNILVAATPLREPEGHEETTKPQTDVFGGDSFLNLIVCKSTSYNGPDLQSDLGADNGSSGSDAESVLVNGPVSGPAKSGSASPLSPSPQTPSDSVNTNATVANISTNGEPREALGIPVDVDAFEMNMDVETDVEVEFDDPEENAMKLQSERVKKVASSWRMKWALNQLKRDDSSSSTSSSASSSTAEKSALLMKSKGKEEPKRRKQSAPMTLSTNRLRRSETNVTPLGKHSLARQGMQKGHWLQQGLVRPTTPNSNSRVSTVGNGSAGKNDVQGVRQQPLVKRSSLVFFTDSGDDTAGPPNKAKSKDVNEDVGCSEAEADEIEISEETWTRLNKFRYQ
ncbi:Exodeoxyribonuclease 1 [Leucoagaricus sp. SymC.cos]|nr:Exodeoxyribonuclease 1 [Leucoagaricus sp. SymC.cos]